MEITHITDGHKIVLISVDSDARGVARVSSDYFQKNFNAEDMLLLTI